jgi:hypothetical protein
VVSSREDTISSIARSCCGIVSPPIPIADKHIAGLRHEPSCRRPLMRVRPEWARPAIGSGRSGSRSVDFIPARPDRPRQPTRARQ